MKRHAKYTRPETVKGPKDKHGYILCYIKETMYLKPLSGHQENDFDTDSFNIINTPFGPGRVMKHTSEKHNYDFKGMDNTILNGKLVLPPKRKSVPEPVYTLDTRNVRAIP
ncbi:MAG: hypothetical protein PHR23_09200, partial [bacterium]|nr:hypothetical protein [bacterium]